MSRRRDRAGRDPELSQHFLRSPALAASLVAQAPIGPDDLVVEIGPGRGALTAELARRAREVRGVELDERLCRELTRRFRDRPNVSISPGDFLRYPLPRDTRYKVVGNVPYSRTTAIVRRLTAAVHAPDDIWLILQREAAERFAGSPFAAESKRSLELKPCWHIEIVRRLKRSDFDPPPHVDSVVLWIARRIRPLVGASEAEAYRRFVATSFGRGGNTVARCLRSSFTRRQIRRLGHDLRFDVDGPPGGLSFDQWLGLFRFSMLTRERD